MPPSCDAQRLPIETGGLPFIQKLEMVMLEERNRCPIPVQHIQHYAEAVFGQGYICDMRQKSIANLFLAELLANVQVFEKEPPALERGITVEEESISRCLLIPFSQERTK